MVLYKSKKLCGESLMKSVLINFAIIFIVIAIYASGILELFYGKTVLWTAIGTIVILFAIAFKILGNPWTGK